MLLGDLIFGLVEFVDEALASGFVGVFEGGDVVALAFFVGVERGEALVDCVDRSLGVGYTAAGFEDGLECGFECGVVIGFVEEEFKLLIVGIGETVGGVAVAPAADVEANGLAGVEFGAEAVDGGRGLFGLGLGVEGPAAMMGTSVMAMRRSAAALWRTKVTSWTSARWMFRTPREPRRSVMRLVVLSPSVETRTAWSAA